MNFVVCIGNVWWPKRVNHKSICQNTKQCLKAETNFQKHKSVYQNTKQFLESHSSRTGCLGADLSTSDAVSSKEPVPKLDTFAKKKKNEQVSHFKRKNKKLKNENDEPVTINIGIMRYVEEESMLKPQQGKSLPIRPKTADSEEVLKLAVAKQFLHNGNETVYSSVNSYKLLYPDGTEVKRMKESNEAFSLQ